MNRLTSLSLVTALTLSAGTASAAVHVEPTPPEAITGIAARVQAPWMSAPVEAEENFDINIHETKTDRFGSSWWGGGYKGDFQLWHHHTAEADNLVAGGSLRGYGKLFGQEREIAFLRAGAHNWGSNVVNGEVVVMGTVIKNWFLTDQELDETYLKSKTFFDVSKDFDIYIFSVGVKATASGYVKLDLDLSMQGGNLQYSVTPEVKAIATGGSSFTILGGGVEIEGRLDPLAFAKLPMNAHMGVRRFRNCTTLNWGADIDLTVQTMAGTITIVLDYWFDSWRKTIASWTGWSRNFSLLNLESSRSVGTCFVLPNPLPLPTLPVLQH